MPSLDIRVIGKLPHESQDPAFPEITNENFGGELKLSASAILRGGMASGKSAIGFLLIGPDGKHYMAQTSAEIITGLAAAINGANELFESM